jgi:hypothetical protein
MHIATTNSRHVAAVPDFCHVTAATDSRHVTATQRRAFPARHVITIWKTRRIQVGRSDEK